MKGIWVMSLLLCGCSTFDSLDSVHASEKADAGDVGTNSDVNLDAQIGADMAVDDMLADLVVDMSEDAPSDMLADASDDSGDSGEVGGCLSELPRTVIPTGHVCQPPPPPETGVASCDVVAQTGCPSGQYCDLLPFSQTEFNTVCRDGLIVTDNTCEFVVYDDLCTSRATVNDPPELQGTCYPGSVCQGVKQTELTSPCSRFCELKSAKGCKPAEYCVPIATQYSAFGVGWCKTDSTACP